MSENELLTEECPDDHPANRELTDAEVEVLAVMSDEEESEVRPIC